MRDLGRRGEDPLPTASSPDRTRLDAPTSLSGSRALEIALLAYVAATPWELFGNLLVTPTQAFGLLFLGAWFISLLRATTTVLLPRFATTLFIALGLWTFATTLWSVSPTTSIVASVSRAFLILSAVAVSSVGAGSVQRIAQTLAVSTAVMSLLVVAAAPTSRYDGLTFADADQNALAFNLCIGFTSATYVMVTTPNRGRAGLNALLAVVIGFAIVLTGSRTGLGSIFGIAAIAAILAVARRRFLRGLFVPVVGIVAWWIAAALDRTPQRLFKFVSAPSLSDSREAIITQFQFFQRDWEALGIGAGADAHFLRLMTGTYDNAHSGLWKTWIELGFVGLILSVALGLCWLWYARRSPGHLLVVMSLGALIPFMYTLGPVNSNALWLLVGIGFIPRPQGSSRADGPASCPQDKAAL